MLLLGLIAFALNLRAVVTSVAGVLTEVQASTGMSSSLAGLLTALPGFIFGVIGYFTPQLSRRIGIRQSLIVAMLLLGAGIWLRTVFTTPWAFIGWSALALAGVAVGNVLAPAYIRAYFPNQLHRMMTVYTLALGVGTVVSASVSAPLLPHLGWQWTLRIWALAALAAAAIMGLCLLVKVSSGRNTKGASASTLALLKQPKAVWLTLFFGIQSMHAYVQMGWLPQICRDQGVSATQAGYMLGVLQTVIIIGAFLAPVILGRTNNPGTIAAFFGLITIPGYAGILWAPSLMWLWIFCLVISNLCFPIALSLIGSSGRTVEVTASLSALVQGVGYVLAGTGPLAVGVLHSSAGGWTVPMVVMILTVPIFALAGYKAAQPGLVG
ncbi:MAG: MFS transporter [Corynebacterium sp.]|nr:MFS transporter [Corynebacterium sp.]